MLNAAMKTFSCSDVMVCIYEWGAIDWAQVSLSSSDHNIAVMHQNVWITST